MGTIPSGEITPEPLYSRRREFLKNSALYLGTTAAIGGGLLLISGAGAGRPPATPPPSASPQSDGLVIAERGKYSLKEALTPYEDATTYNNFYELGTGKDDPAK